MKIFLDDQEWKSLDVAHPAKVADLLERVQDDEDFPSDRVAVAVEIGGDRWDPTDPDFEELETDEATDTVLRVITSSADELIIGSIDDAVAAFEVIATATVESARRFRVESLSDALSYFVQLMDRVRMTMEFWGELRGYLAVLFVDETAELDSLQERLRGALNEAMEFQKDSDWVMLADTAEHDLAEIFSLFRDRLRDLGEKLAT